MTTDGEGEYWTDEMIELEREFSLIDGWKDVPLNVVFTLTKWITFDRKRVARETHDKLRGNAFLRDWGATLSPCTDAEHQRINREIRNGG